MKNKKGKLLKKKEVKDEVNKMKGRNPIQFVQLRPCDKHQLEQLYGDEY